MNLVRGARRRDRKAVSAQDDNPLLDKVHIDQLCAVLGSKRVAALFVPKPEARCTVERAQFAGGRIDHVMTCPQKKGPPMRIVRAGSYGATGFTARMTMTGDTDKGAMRIVADQVAARTGPVCKR